MKLPRPTTLLRACAGLILATVAAQASAALVSISTDFYTRANVLNGSSEIFSLPDVTSASLNWDGVGSSAFNVSLLPERYLLSADISATTVRQSTSGNSAFADLRFTAQVDQAGEYEFSWNLGGSRQGVDPERFINRVLFYDFFMGTTTPLVSLAEAGAGSVIFNAVPGHFYGFESFMRVRFDNTTELGQASASAAFILRPYVPSSGTSGGSNPVPEPASLWLVALGALALCAQRRCTAVARARPLPVG
jgi:hypothetical protein